MRAFQVVLCNPVRTPIGTYISKPENILSTTLGATVIREVLSSNLNSARVVKCAGKQTAKNLFHKFEQGGATGGEVSAESI